LIFSQIRNPHSAIRNLFSGSFDQFDCSLSQPLYSLVKVFESLVVRLPVEVAKVDLLKHDGDLE
jgi:hypothetical protein